MTKRAAVTDNNKKMNRSANRRKRHPKLAKHLVILASCVGVLLLLIIISFQVSPRPGALVIRALFNRGGQKTLKAMEAALPDYPVTVLANQPYRPHDQAALLDVYIPNKALQENRALPTVIWTHGGAWLSGDKADDAPYFKRLADQGFVVVVLNYSLAPGKTYPTPVHELNDSYAYIQTNANRFHIDPDKIVLAGDSAGAQLSSQMAAIITNPAYAREVGVQSRLKPSQLAGVVLFCGIYKVEKLVEPSPSLPKIIDWGNNTTVWAYTGSRGTTTPVVRQMSTYYHVTATFPPTFISGGNADPLTDTQSVPFSSTLRSLGVSVTTLFYPSNHQPKLPHEYQFTFNQDGEQAFGQTVQFLKTITN